MPIEARLSALIHWLIAGAPGPEGFPQIIGEIGQRLLAADLPVDQFGVWKTLIHPEQPGTLDYWSPAAGARTRAMDPKRLQERKWWVGTPQQVCQSTGRMVNYMLGSDPRFDDREDMQDLMRRGYTNVLCLPLHSRYTPAVNNVGFATKSAGGFTTDQIDALRRLQAPIARLAEGFVLHKGTIAVLSTYVGREAGERVLSGNILRGDAEVIPSIVLFVDLNNYTSLSNKIPPKDVIEILNEFFINLDTAVVRHGGEILKLVGDGALCIFQTPDDQSAQIAAAAAALAALEDARHLIRNHTSAQFMEFRAALHLGDVHYGNIGSKNRLDFTIVGPTVNLAARLLTVASNHGEDTVFSASIAALLGVETKCIGEEKLKGFDDPFKVYALA